MEEGKLFRRAGLLFELGKYAIVAIITLALIMTFVIAPQVVSGESMKPNFKSGEVVLVSRLINPSQLERGDVVAVRFPADPDQSKLIKRVVGLPGDTISTQDGHLTLNGQALAEAYNPIVGPTPYQELSSITLKNNEYFLAGDNRPGSSDSRLWGPAFDTDILGKVVFVFYPFVEMRSID